MVRSDVVGNRQTNQWTYQLEVPAQASTNVIVLGGASPIARQAAQAAGLTLISRSGDQFVYGYMGASSGLSIGKHLVDGTPGHSYARTVLELVDDPATKTVSVMTEPASLANLIEEGSLSGSSMSIVRLGPQRQWDLDWEAGPDFDFSHYVDLSQVVYENEGPNGMVRIEILPGSKLDLKAAMGFAANFHFSSLQDFQAYVSGSVDLRVEVLAQAAYGQRWEGEVPLLKEPIRQFYGAMIGPVPVEVETELSFNLLYKAEVQAQGHLQTGLTAFKRVFMGRRWENGQWRDISEYPPLEFGRLGPNWQLEGKATARVDVVPRLTIYFYSLAGLWGELDPYAEFDGQFKANPWEYDWTLYGGLDAKLGSDFRLIDKLFPDINFTKNYTLIQKTVILHDDNKSKIPTIKMNPQAITRNVGESAVFGASAEGTDPLAYRWQKNGEDLADDGRIGGSGTSRLVISPVQISDDADYRVRVSNSAGSVTSQAARLTVKVDLPSNPDPQKLVLISPGTFTMGSPANEAGRWDDEDQHSVTISHGFWMGKYEVTQREYQAVMGSNPSYFLGDLDRPVEQVTWHDATNYCGKLTVQERAAGRLPAGYVYRLPTEAEWEYACRAGTTTPFSFGNELRSGNRYVNFDGHYDYPPCGGEASYCYNGNGIYLGETTPVGSYLPNGWGLYDMHGNVWEWCLDWYGDYPAGGVTDPRGPISGSVRVIRGGSWLNLGWGCRSATRGRNYPSISYNCLGFRVVLAPGP